MIDHAQRGIVLWLEGNRCSDTLRARLVVLELELWLEGNRCSDTLHTDEGPRQLMLWLEGNRCSDTLVASVIWL